MMWRCPDHRAGNLKVAHLVTDRLTETASTDTGVLASGSSAPEHVVRLPTTREEPGVVSYEDEERLERLTRVCMDDVFTAISRVPVGRLARQVLAFDEVVGESGIGAGGSWALERMCRSARIEGRENVPLGGPLLLVSNHPGLADAVALFAATPREDLRAHDRG